LGSGRGIFSCFETSIIFFSFFFWCDFTVIGGKFSHEKSGFG